jgi:hypothetical protein
MRIIFALLFFVGCTQPAVKETPSPTTSPSPIASQTPAPIASEKVWPLTGWLPEYDAVINNWTPVFTKSDYAFSRVCPNFKNLTLPEKNSLWTNLWRGIGRCETDYKRASWMPEDLGKDPVTGTNVISQGLLQLSYQDVRNHKTLECHKISWEIDKAKRRQMSWKNKLYWVVNDPNATINHPIINLECGMSIARKLLNRYPNGSPTQSKGTGLGEYWSCSRPGKRGITEFQKMFPRCK